MNNQFNNNGENLNNNINNQNMQQPMNQNVQQPMSNPQPMNQNVQQPMGNPQPMNQNMQQPMGNPQYNNNQKNNNTLVIALAVGVFVIIAVVVALFVVAPMLDKKDDKNNGNVNEYEDNNSSVVNPTPSPSSSPSQNVTQSNTITYNGFEFTKLSGYEYEIDEDVLIVGNDNIVFLLSPCAISMSSVRTNYNQAVPVLQGQGYTVGQVKHEYYSGTEVFTYEISQESEKGLYFFIPSTNSSYIFEGVTMTRSNNFDYNSINTLASIVKNAQFKGNTSNFATEFGTGIDLNKIQIEK